MTCKMHIPILQPFPSSSQKYMRDPIAHFAHQHTPSLRSQHCSQFYSWKHKEWYTIIPLFWVPRKEILSHGMLAVFHCDGKNLLICRMLHENMCSFHVDETTQQHRAKLDFICTLFHTSSPITFWCTPSVPFNDTMLISKNNIWSVFCCWAW